MIERFLLPEDACLAKMLIDLVRCKRLPGMEDVRETIITKWRDQSVDMVSGNNLLVQDITIAVEVMQRIVYNLVRL